MSTIGAIADAAARAVASMFIVLGAGVAFAYTGKLDAEGLRALGITINWLFVPAIMFDSFGAGLSWEALQTLWVVAIIGLCTAPVSALISYPGMVLSKPPIWFREWFMFGATFQNTVALPLVLIQTICSQISVPLRDNRGDIIYSSNETMVLMTQQQCTTRGELYIFMYIFLHSFLFWIVAYDLMPSKTVMEDSSRDADDLEESPSRKGASSPDDFLVGNGDSLTGSSMPAIKADDSGATETTNEPSANMNVQVHEAEPISESGDPVSVYMTGTMGMPTSPKKRPSKMLGNDDYIAGSFYGGTATMNVVRQVAEDAAYQPQSTCCGKLRQKSTWLFFHILSLFARPPILAQLLGTFIGLIQPLQEAFFSPTSVLRPITLSIKIFAVASTAVTNLSMSGGLGLKMKESKVRHLFGGGPGGLSRRATAGFVLTRMVVIPGVLFGLTYALQTTKIIPNDRLLLMVLYMQAMTPSANMCVVVPQILGNLEASGALSLLVLSQYLVALPSMLLWLSLAFYVTSDLL